MYHTGSNTPRTKRQQTPFATPEAGEPLPVSVAENTPIRGPSPQTQGPGPTPPEGGSNLPPAAEAFPLADFDQAQKVLEEIRGAKAYVRALVETFPEASHIKVNTERLRQHLATITSKLDFAERACLQLGLPF